ncbi:MAG: hypothetical protein MUE60_13155 [Candidatus Eisenbacteria bacterium]|jgi:hypothetical protein|nr:hypothetical protein [Candidatus Eisenbacteria bacterium]
MNPSRKHLLSSIVRDYVMPGGITVESNSKERFVQRGPVIVMCIAIQLILLIVGLVLTGQWARGAGLWHGWWANLPMVGILLASLLVFSNQEARFGFAASRRNKSEPERMGGWLEAVAFTTWLALLVNMLATVFKIIRAIKAAR